MELRKLLYRYDETAEFFSVCVQSVRRLVDSGELERVYVAAREPRITRESILAYIERKKLAYGSRAHLS